jgi:shikimate kinase
MDKYIENMTSKTIPQLFENGEEYFRDFETLACKELSDKNNVIISSGGGVVKRKENIDVLKKDAYIIFINRPLVNLLDDVDISNRPLLKEGKEKVIKLYEERYELYKLYADIIVENDKSVRDTVNKVKEIINK